MPNYQRKNLADGSAIGVPGELPAELCGLEDASLADLGWVGAPLSATYSGQGFVPVPAPSPAPPPRRTISSLELIQRLTPATRIAIRTASQTDPVVADFLDMLAKALNGVDLDHADTIAGVGYLVSTGVLNAAQAAAIRA